MTGAECEAHILSTVGGDLANHPIPDLNIKYHNQRSPEEYSETYYMYGVPTNLKGEVDCNLNEGHIIYPWEWIGIDRNGYEIPKIPCAGLDAIACCTAVEKMMKDQGIPLTDLSGNCFSCWVHQEPLIPRLDPDSGDVVYLDYIYNNISKTCDEVIYTKQEVQEEDRKTKQHISGIISWIDEHLFWYSGMDIFYCPDFLPLQKEILLHARSFPTAMNVACGMFCGHVSSACGRFCGLCEFDSNPDQQKFTELERMPTINSGLEYIASELQKPLRSDENCIIIYTDFSGINVIKAPQIGGRLNHLIRM